MDVERLDAEEAAGWIELAGLFDRVAIDRFEEPTLTPDGWSPKDAMFHVIAWCDEASEALDRVRTGTADPTDDETIEKKNRRFFETSRAMDPDEVRSRFAPARDRMVRSWARLDEITPGAWEWFDESGPRHYAGHVRDLRRWLEGAP
jgi:hypothetical protein